MRIGDEIRQDRKVRAFHEAGHAVVNVYIGLPFASVSLLGVDFGMVDDTRCDAAQLIKVAKSTTAGILATHRYDRLHPDAPLVHTDREGEQDEQTLKEIAEHLKLSPSDAAIRAWKDEVQDLLETPQVWNAVEKLARQLQEIQGFDSIPEKLVRAILQDATHC